MLGQVEPAFMVSQAGHQNRPPPGMSPRESMSGSYGQLAERTSPTGGYQGSWAATRSSETGAAAAAGGSLSRRPSGGYGRSVSAVQRGQAQAQPPGRVGVEDSSSGGQQMSRLRR